MRKRSKFSLKEFDISQPNSSKTTAVHGVDNWIAMQWMIFTHVTANMSNLFSQELRWDYSNYITPRQSNLGRGTNTSRHTITAYIFSITCSESEYSELKSKAAGQGPYYGR